MSAIAQRSHAGSGDVGCGQTPIDKIQSALGFVEPHDRDVWVKVGMAVHAELGEAGFWLWDDWSQGAESYHAASAKSVWKSFRRGKVGIGTLFFLAKESGWKWTGPERRLSQAEVEAIRAESRKKAEAAAAEKAKQQAIAAERANAIWNDLQAVVGGYKHPYSDAKGVLPYGLRVGKWETVDADTGEVRLVTDNALVVPIRDRTGKLWSLQALLPKKLSSGTNKLYLSDGAKQGHFHAIGKPKEHDGRKVFVLAEGYATGASIHQATGHCVLVTFDTSNLLPVAAAIRERQPDAIIVMAADNDQWKDPRRNPGVEAATEAALAVSGCVAIPPFERKDQTGIDEKGRPVGPTDWNDWHLKNGLSNVAFHINKALEAGPIAIAEDPAEYLEPPPADATADASAAETQGAGQTQEAALVAGLVSDADDAGAGDGDADQISVVRPSFVTYEEFTSFGKPGLYYHGVKQKGETEVEFDQWIASPIHAMACTSDERDTNHGLVLRLFSSSGRWREFAVPMQLLSGSGEELRAGLLDMGMRIDVDGHRLLNRWLMNCKPKKRLTAAKTVGWHGDGSTRAFVLPSKTVGNQDVILQSDRVGHDEFTTNGSLQGWRQEIGRLCAGNRWLVLAVAAALAGPVLKLVSRPGVGIHFVGDSSQGKSTLLHASTSVWGGLGFMRTWRATSNGLEGVAAALNDTALILDEISEAPPADVGAIVYSIGNGTGKSRAGRNGKAREVAKWRLSLISSGEKTLATIMGEAGKSVNAGQDVRMLEIPAVRSFGVLDELHGLEDGAAVSNRIRAAANEEHYGHLGPAFVERLIADGRDFRKAHKEYVADPGFIACHPLEVRAAEALALIALAGELATEYGLTGWTKGEALDAAVEAFKKWKEFRGEGQTETRRILQAVETFIDRHGDSRFSDAAKDVATQVRDRAGWWRDDEGGRIYLFTGTGLKEAMKGFEFNQGLEALSKSGWIVAFDKGKHSKNTRVNGNQKRLYLIRPKVDDESVCSGGADSSTEPERAPSESPAPSARQRPSRDEDFSEPPV